MDKRELRRFTDVGGWFVLTLSQNDRYNAELIESLLDCTSGPADDPVGNFLRDQLCDWHHRRVSLQNLQKNIANLALELENTRCQAQAYKELLERYPELVAEPAHATRPAEAE